MPTLTPAYDRILTAFDAHGIKYKDDRHGRCRAQCPAHGGEDLNLSVAVGDQGVLLKCHVYDCPAEDIARAVGLQSADLFDQDGHATYDYGNGHRVHRYRTREGKTIRQENHPGKVTSLYRHPNSQSIEDAEQVVLVEGEKCVDAGLRLGLPCVTTWPGGTGGVMAVDLTPLSGKRVRIIADNDEPGHRAAVRMMLRLEGLASVEGVWVVPGEKRGIDDLYLDGGSLSELLTLDTAPYMAASEPKMREGVVEFLEGKKSRAMRWLWKGIIPYGYASVFAGFGGVSKSTFSLWLAGRVTRGLVDGILLDRPSTVLYVSHEDGVEDVVIPRAQVNNVDLSRFGTFGIRMKQSGGLVMPRFPDDLDELEEAILRTDAKLIIVDPILSTMDSARNMNDARDVRLLIDPLNQLAQRLEVAIICIAHLNKGGAGDVVNLMTGSKAWSDATRGTIIFAAEKPEDNEPQRVVISKSKQNYSRNGESFTYQIIGVDHLHDSGEVESVPKIQWLGHSDRSVQDIVQETTEDRRLGDLSHEVLAFIEAQQGAVGVKAIIEEFKDEKPQTVRVTVSRLSKRGRIDSPAYGIYQAMRYAAKPK